MGGACVKTLILSITLFVPANADITAPTGSGAVTFPACQKLKSFDYRASEYKGLSRHKLTAMGEAGHPVGLYYMAQQALKAGQRQRAKSLLLRAAQAGLMQAYQQLSELEKHDGNRVLSHHYKRCAQTQFSP